MQEVPLTCGKTLWGHGGNEAGHSTSAFTTLDGKHRFVASINTYNAPRGRRRALRQTGRGRRLLTGKARGGGRPAALTWHVEPRDLPEPRASMRAGGRRVGAHAGRTA
ncbi:hypothetical protein Ssi02_56880 [Sinosporangium siamense]|uniref:Uncharacterized protein n=1 Tax=Sinosporangium siamense TaxID=1367973 RepID=A0A919RLL8_9ACTN|nr:hypothetical protein Ssi02_56880 [Sinosporangium siamense]